ncbi:MULTISPECIES: LytR/AlgR family response regulator transcription factor [unclassified Mucilaginibacter]|uniref:LytR/AlgR family response regulator transcription factor n=1 Tax=unclassified Mucilaginibacter TaxID=2617802 RepID=UPI00096216E2|nr:MULTISPECIES: LytTR family DNA-binding domain-containing protein [unclassified Mucilaginibacter]OJW17004.1 MAG: DNA-binding response regulator [Mucilaginibacter sp. 44-25]PLW91566.1 MAG: DNA-binding response regulator [Mucilaginibacter sp.]HEK21861.1 response regulator transcription factor [Bacteroidota bacterium]
MEKFKCVIIDDDRYAIEGLTSYIKAVPNLELIRSYEDPIEALIAISTMPMVDLILLDIHMPKMTGLQLSKEIRAKTHKLIFTTSYTQFAYEAFEAEADGYLLKPFSLPKFAATVSKMLSNVTTGVRNYENDHFFFVKNKIEDLKIIKVWYRDIVAVESQQNYVLIHTTNKKILTYISLKEVGKMLAAFPDFVQFQRSFIIAKSHIHSITGNNIKMDNQLEFTVGDLYRSSFQRFVQYNLLKTGM